MNIHERNLFERYIAISKTPQGHKAVFKVGVQSFKIIETDEGEDHAKWFGMMFAKSLVNMMNEENIRFAESLHENSSGAPEGKDYAALVQQELDIFETYRDLTSHETLRISYSENNQCVMLGLSRQWHGNNIHTSEPLDYKYKGLSWQATFARQITRLQNKIDLQIPF